MEISVKVQPQSADATVAIAVITGVNHGGYAATEARLKFLGASCHSSVLSGTGTDTPMGISSFTIQVEKGKRAVIALIADVRGSVGKRTLDRREARLIPVCWDDSVIEVKHNFPFIPKQDCLGQIIGDDLVVVVGDKRFSTCNRTQFGEVSNQQKMQKLQADGYAIVPSGDLLCRFLVGDATLEEVEKAVIAESVNVVELQTKVLKLEGELAEVQHSTQAKQAYIQGLNEMMDKKVAALGVKESLIGRLDGVVREKNSKISALQTRVMEERESRLKDLELLVAIASNSAENYQAVHFGWLPWVALGRVKKKLCRFITLAKMNQGMMDL